MVDAKFFCDLQAVSHGIEANDAPRSARLGHRRAVEPEKAEPLDDHGIAQADFGGFGY